MELGFPQILKLLLSTLVHTVYKEIQIVCEIVVSNFLYFGREHNRFVVKSRL